MQSGALSDGPACDGKSTPGARVVKACHVRQFLGGVLSNLQLIPHEAPDDASNLLGRFLASEFFPECLADRLTDLLFEAVGALVEFPTVFFEPLDAP